ncbi:MAG: conjugative transposon protein TraM [Bacteroidota bacterium]|nr:conjugative transposon protein TraM [Bacteroidota bacterium]
MKTIKWSFLISPLIFLFLSSYSNPKDKYIKVIANENLKVYEEQIVEFYNREELFTKNVTIPKLTQFFATSKIINGRMCFLVNKIKVGNDVYDVKLIAFDVDYVEGLTLGRNKKWLYMPLRLIFRVG